MVLMQAKFQAIALIMIPYKATCSRPFLRLLRPAGKRQNSEMRSDNKSWTVSVVRGTCYLGASAALNESPLLSNQGALGAFGACGAAPGALGGLGAPGAAGAPGLPGAPVAPATGAASAGGMGAPQNGHFTGLKLGETIFFPHSWHTIGP